MLPTIEMTPEDEALLMSPALMEISDDDITCTWSGTSFDVRRPFIKTEPGCNESAAQDPIASVSPLGRALPHVQQPDSNSTVDSTIAPPPQALRPVMTTNATAIRPTPAREHMSLSPPLASSSRALLTAAFKPLANATASNGPVVSQPPPTTTSQPQQSSVCADTVQQPSNSYVGSGMSQSVAAIAKPTVPSIQVAFQTPPTAAPQPLQPPLNVRTEKQPPTVSNTLAGYAIQPTVSRTTISGQIPTAVYAIATARPVSTSTPATVHPPMPTYSIPATAQPPLSTPSTSSTTQPPATTLPASNVALTQQVVATSQPPTAVAQQLSNRGNRGSNRQRNRRQNAQNRMRHYQQSQPQNQQIDSELIVRLAHRFISQAFTDNIHIPENAARDFVRFWHDRSIGRNQNSNRRRRF